MVETSACRWWRPPPRAHPLCPPRAAGAPARASADRVHCRAPVPVETKAIGKTFPPVTYAVGREKVREYAHAVGEANPVHLDPEAARAAGYADVVAPPMFAVVYSSPAVAPALFDPEVGIDFARMLHGSQEFVWGPVVVAGDEIETGVSLKDISERVGMSFFVFESVSKRVDGETVCTGTWTNIVRGGET